MNTVLTDEQRLELLKRGFSRRNFGRIAAMMGAGAASMPFFNEPALAQLSRVEAPPDAVLINANENPLGPCKEAREAAHRMVDFGGRYRYSEGERVQKLLAEQEGLKFDYVRIHPGSSGPLHQAVLAFTSPTRPFVTADPGYEAGIRTPPRKHVGDPSPSPRLRMTLRTERRLGPPHSRSRRDVQCSAVSPC